MDPNNKTEEMVQSKLQRLRMMKRLFAVVLTISFAFDMWEALTEHAYRRSLDYARYNLCQEIAVLFVVTCAHIYLICMGINF